MDKLDPALQRLVTGKSRGPDRYSSSEKKDGTVVYSVILHSDNPKALRDTNLQIGSVQGNVVTARLTIAQIRKAAQMKAVQKIENAKQFQPHR